MQRVQRPTGLDYEKLFRNLPGSYIVFDVDDPKFTILDENDSHAALSMADRENIIGKGLIEAYPDNSDGFKKTGTNALLESFRKVIKTKQPDDQPVMRYDLREPTSGKFVERYFKVTHYPLCDDAGKVVAVYQSSVDVTDQTAADLKLQHAESRLKEALDIAEVGAWSWDIRRNVVMADRNLARMFGVTYEQAAAGLPLTIFTDSIHPADQKRVLAEINRTLKKHVPFDSEYRTIDSEGATHWLLARGQVELDATGKPEQFPGVLLDITDRKRSDMARNFLVAASTVLAGSLHYKQTFKKVATLAVPEIADWCAVDILADDGVHLSQIALAHKDPAMMRWAREVRQKVGPDTIHVNAAFARAIEKGEPEFVAAVNDEMLRKMVQTPEQLAYVRKLDVTALIRVPLRRDGVAVGLITLVGTGGRHFTDIDLKMAVELANHASLAVSNAYQYDTARDELSKRQKLEERLRSANEQLEKRVKERTVKLEELNSHLQRSNRELQDFAYVASHDLQEPLRKIQAFGNLLEQEYGKRLGDGGDYLSRMRNAAARMSELISDLLSFSRVTTQVRPFAPTDLQLVVDEVLGDLETRLDDCGGKVKVGKLPTIDADAMQMRQVFQNLISNALKFHQPDTPPVVTVSAKTTSSQGVRYAAITIGDNGVGFDEKYLDRIFAVFQRLHGRDEYEGTGIGLAVCRKIVERHHGTITARSVPGQGASFTISLPIHQEQQERIPA